VLVISKQFQLGGFLIKVRLQAEKFWGQAADIYHFREEKDGPINLYFWHFKKWWC